MTAEEKLTPAERNRIMLDRWGYGDKKASVTEMGLVHFWTIFSSQLKTLTSLVVDPNANNTEMHISGHDELEGVLDLLKHSHFYNLFLLSVNGTLKERQLEPISRFEVDHTKPSIRFVREQQNQTGY